MSGRRAPARHASVHSRCVRLAGLRGTRGSGFAFRVTLGRGRTIDSRFALRLRLGLALLLTLGPALRLALGLALRFGLRFAGTCGVGVLARALAVLAVVSDVEPAALE